MDRGIREYERGAYEKALETFRESYGSEAPEANVYASLSLFMMIKSEFRLGKYTGVTEDSRIFERLFPSSRYLPDVLFERAKALAARGQYSPALQSAVRILSLTEDKELLEDVMEFCDDVTRYYCSPADIEMILPLVIGRESLSYIKLLLARRYIAAGDHSSAELLLREVKTELYTEAFVRQYKDITKYLNKSRDSEEPEINIAVVLPLTGRYSETGNQLLEGIKYAYDEQRSQSRKRVNLIIADTQSEIKTGLKVLREILGMQNITAVLGPLNSETAISMAPLCEYAGVPLITPTATADDLVDMGENVFQLNPEQQKRAMALADHTADSLGYRRYAVVAPANDYGIEITNAFRRGVEKNGGSVISNVWYSGTPTDINDKLEDLQETAEYLPPYFSYLEGYYKAREEGLFETDSATAGESIMDSVLTDSLAYDTEQMDSLYAAYHEDTVKTEADTSFLLEALWPDDPLTYEIILQGLSDTTDIISDTLLERFRRQADAWLSGEITPEERYNARITDSLCILLEALQREQIPVWLDTLAAVLDTVAIDTAYLADYHFSPLVPDTTELAPYIDMDRVDSLKTELADMDSLSAIWLLSETDPALFPYIFPHENYGIDAVYMPIPLSHIKFIAPQWAKHRFNALLLGDGNWYNTTILNRYRSNIDSMLIASDYYWDSRDIELRRFARDFRQKTGEQANRIHIYGYESMDLLMDLFEKEALRSAKELRRQLSTLKGTYGIIRRIRFEPGHPRSSSGVRIIRFYKGRITPLN